MTDPHPPRSPFLDAAGLSPLVLDAALGTRLIARGLLLDRDDPSLWNLTHPDEVTTVHALDLAAGARAVLTNTFGANRLWLDRFGRAAETAAINRRAAALARAAAGPDYFVIGSIGPTAVGNPDDLREQAEALAAGGVDALLFETFRPDQAATALAAILDLDRLPRIVSLLDVPAPDGASLRRLEDLGVAVLGGNCQAGMAAAVRAAERLRGLTRRPLWIKPAAGLPGAPPDTPEAFAAGVPRLLDHGVRFLGGCCGTTEAHVAALHAACYAR